MNELLRFLMTDRTRLESKTFNLASSDVLEVKVCYIDFDLFFMY